MSNNKWIRKGDKVVVIAGNEKGQVATVLARSENKILLEGLNIRKKHVKPKQRMQPGIVEMETPIHISNVMLIDKNSGKPSRVGFTINKEGKKSRVAKKSGEAVS